MGRFDPPPTPDVLNQQALGRIESAMSALVDQLAALGALPTPQVNVSPTPISVSTPEVQVPLEPLVDAISRMNEQMAEVLSRPVTIPPINLESPTVQMDLAPLHDQQEQVRKTLEAITERVTSLRSGSKAVYDGRLRDANGNRINPARQETLEEIATALGAPSGTEVDTRLDYDVRTDTNPVYVGKAPLGTVTSASDWTVTILEYDGDARLTRSYIRDNVAWDDRATL